MFFKAALVFSLVVSSFAYPHHHHHHHPRNVKAKRGVLSVQNYSGFQVSDGPAGNALARVNEKFPIDLTNPAAVDAEDLAILKAARKTAEAAETKTGGFNEAIEAAGGKNTAAGQALQCGKIANKVLKLQLQVMILTIENAQRKNRTEKLAQQQAKLEKNVALDQEAGAQGLVCSSVDFQGTSEP